jgi:hypothetical protein
MSFRALRSSHRYPLAPLALLALLVSGPFVACGGGSSSQPGELDAALDGATEAADDAALEAGDDALQLDTGPSCPSMTLCGAAGTCCGVGQECVDGACAAPCASGVRCGATCCGASEVCLAGACTAPLGACKDSFDCDDGQFCEPTLGKCLPQPPTASTCEYKPPVAPFEPIVEWSWTGSTIKPTYYQVINVPLVIDLDKDKTPDVVIVTSDQYSDTGVAFVRALDGKTGAEKWPAAAEAYLDANQVNPRATPAVGDLDGDGTIEIVALARTGGVIAFRADGSVRSRSVLADGTTAYKGSFNSGTVALADMDADGKSEVIVGGVVLDSNLKVISGVGREHAGENAAGYGAVSIVADVDDDGKQDVVTGKAAWKMDGTVIWSQSTLNDGYPAIADFDADGKPELVVVSRGTIRVQNAATGALLATLTMPGSGNGGPPTIADFDADGVMEMSSANGSKYSVFEYTSKPTPALSVRWSASTQDLSSNVTGSSVFDFEGDGSAEVVYGDECYVRVYSGKDGTVLFQAPSTSATIHEYPVLVDVDGDGNTEFVVVSNDANHVSGGVTCPTGVTPRHGVFVYGDAHDRWVRTRKLWNQHAYHITNVETSGALPKGEPKSWVAPAGFDNYRVSSQGTGVYNAPDLKVDLEVSTATCPASLEIRARVANVGSLGVPAGVRVEFFLGAPPATGATAFVTAFTTKPLLPGGSEVVTATHADATIDPLAFTVVVDGAAASGTSIHECNEANNSGSVGGARCPRVQ